MALTLSQNIQNLCSGFSYCVSALGTIYIWHGIGSLPLERQATVEYARSIAGNSELVEMNQGENDDNDMFWMLLGNEPFADADYWRWRTSVLPSDSKPTVWRVDVTKRTSKVRSVLFVSFGGED